MSSETPIALVPGLDTILADVEQLAKEAHTFITCDKQTHRQVASEWVPLCTKLKRRLRNLQQFVDEVPPVLWDIVFAGRDGGGLGGQMQPEMWREYEAQRHANVLEQIANIKSAIRPDSWEGDDWDALEPQVRQLLLYMQGRKQADLRVLCPEVWGKEYLTDHGVTEAARETATSKANKFLSKRQSRRLLEKVRKEPYLRWV